MSARDKFIALTAGFWREHTDTWMCTSEHIEIFANLIRADEREACLNCYSPDDTATDWADKIRARENK